MKKTERLRYLRRSPKLARDLLFRGRYDSSFDLMPVHLENMSPVKRWNIVKTGLNLIHRRLMPYGWPIFMQIELTNYCNLHCPVCPTGLGLLDRKPAAMDEDLFGKLLAEVGPYLIVLALWAWGEPLLHPAIDKILAIVGKYNLVTLLSTNGQNLNDDAILSSLIDHPPTYLIVCIDGLTDETNEKFRVGARLAPILDGVARLQELKRQRNQSLPVLHMRHIAMKHNQHELPEVRQFARDHRFDMLSIRGLSIIDSPEARHHDFLPENDEYQSYSYNQGKRVSKGDNFVCQMPFISPTVLADGTVVSCDQDFNAQQPLGVFSSQTSFADIWFGPKATEIRKVIKQAPLTFTFCRNCPYADHKHKTCSIESFQLNALSPATSPGRSSG